LLVEQREQRCVVGLLLQRSNRCDGAGHELAHARVLAEEQFHRRIGRVAAARRVERQHVPLLVVHVQQQPGAVAVEPRARAHEVAVEQRALLRREHRVEAFVHAHHRRAQRTAACTAGPTAGRAHCSLTSVGASASSSSTGGDVRVVPPASCSTTKRIAMCFAGRKRSTSWPSASETGPPSILSLSVLARVISACCSGPPPPTHWISRMCARAPAPGLPSAWRARRGMRANGCSVNASAFPSASPISSIRCVHPLPSATNTNHGPGGTLHASLPSRSVRPTLDASSMSTAL